MEKTLVSRENFDKEMNRLSETINGIIEGIVNYEEDKKISNNQGLVVDAEGFCVSDFIPVEKQIAYTVVTNDVSLTGNYIIEYNSNKEPVDYWTAAPNRSFMSGQNTKYIRFTFNKGFVATVSEQYEPFTRIYIATHADGLYTELNKKADKKTGTYSPDDIPLQYDIGNGYFTRGYLKLPSNYSLEGESIPLIVFIHGSGDFGYLEAPMTLYYNDYYNYLRDCGYAVFDCYAFGNKYTYGHTEPNTWGIPINDACYEKGVEYVCSNYNVDRNRVFVSCKSLGGIQAMSLYYNPNIKIKAIGMLAPELCVFDVEMGYNATLKKIIANELCFSEDTNNVLNYNNSTDPTPSGFWDYITDNMDKWCGYFTDFIGLPIKDSDKPQYYKLLYRTGEMQRQSIGRPVKIWISPDDSAVSYDNAKAFIKSIHNSGFKGELRTMPMGAGGHHSVDNDERAPSKQNVTTPLGIHYDSVPLAYYELEKYFRQHW